jgi:hypothetical protein
MSTEPSINRRAALAVAVASAAVTLAVAVTLASFLGYMQPSSRAASPPAQADAPARTVLVPVEPKPPAWQALGAEPPADARRISASAEERDLHRRREHEDEHEHHRARGERRHDD